MEVIINEENGKVRVSLNGRLDTVTFGNFETMIKPVIEKASPDIIIDCSGLVYVSSAGLRVFLIIQKKVAENRGKLLLTNLQAHVKEVFDMTGFSSIFEIK